MVRIGGCLTVAFSCDDVKAPAIEADDRLGYVRGEIPRFTCVCVSVKHTAALYPDLHAQGKAVVVAELGEEGKSNLGNVHTMLHISHDLSIPLCLAPQVDKIMYVVYLFSLDFDVGTAVFLRFFLRV